MKAILIGATSGIGKELARRFIGKGWTVGLCGRRGKELENIMETYGTDKVCIAALDVTGEESADTLDGLLERFGAPDLFLYVSGVGYQNRELDEDKELRTVRTNCEGMVRMTTHFINYVRKHPETYSKEHKAHIAVVTSVAGTAGLGTAPAYSASKKMESTYVSALAQLAAMESYPVFFSDIRPGFVQTGLLREDKSYPLTMTVEKAADCIIRGLERRKRVITFDWRYRTIVFFWRLIPARLWERIKFVKI